MNSELELEAISWIGRDRSLTHWEGCHNLHSGCMVGVLLSEIYGLEKYVSSLEEEVKSITQIAYSDWNPPV